MANAYITLANSNDSLIKRFVVIQESHVPVIDKSQTIDKTLDGDLDIATGGVYDSYECVVKVPHTVLDDDYGNLADLKTFFRYNRPNGTPSNRIELTDHYGVAHECVMHGQFKEQLLGVVLEGNEANYLVACLFIYLPEVVIVS